MSKPEKCKKERRRFKTEEMQDRREAARGLVLSEVNPKASERGVVDFREWAHVFA